VSFRDHEKPIDEGFALIQSEVQHGRFPILSVYCNPIGWPIWVAVPDGKSFRLISRTYGDNNPLEMNDLNDVRENLNQHRGGKINFVTYDLTDPNGT